MQDWLKQKQTKIDTKLGHGGEARQQLGLWEVDNYTAITLCYTTQYFTLISPPPSSVFFLLECRISIFCSFTRVCACV